MNGKSNNCYDVCIVGGLGYVGLFLGFFFVDVGKNVVLYDIDRVVIEKVFSGKMFFLEVGVEVIFKNVFGKKFYFLVDNNVIKNSNFVVVVIGIFIDEYFNFNFILFKKFFEKIIDFIIDE